MAESEVQSEMLFPDCAPGWWPKAWPWPPAGVPAPTTADDVSQLEAWVAKIDRDFEEYSDRGHRRQHEDHRLDEKMDDERFDAQTRAADRQAARETKSDNKEADQASESRMARDAQRAAASARTGNVQAELNRLYDRQASQREDTRAEGQRVAERTSKREENRAQVGDELRHHRLQAENMLLTAYLERNADQHNIGMQILQDGMESARVARGVTWNVQFSKAVDNMLAQKVQDAVTTAVKEALGPPRGGTTTAPAWGYPPGQPTPTVE